MFIRTCLSVSRLWLPCCRTVCHVCPCCLLCVLLVGGGKATRRSNTLQCRAAAKCCHMLNMSVMYGASRVTCNMLINNEEPGCMTAHLLKRTLLSCMHMNSNIIYSDERIDIIW